MGIMLAAGGQRQRVSWAEHGLALNSALGQSGAFPQASVVLGKNLKTDLQRDLERLLVCLICWVLESREHEVMPSATVY